MRATILSLALLTLPATTLAAADTTPITGIYSSIQLSPEEGDYAGTEVQILESSQGGVRRYHALVQFAEGEPTPPQLVDAVIEGTHVAFKARYAGIQEVEFSGSVIDNALKGTFSGLAGEVILPRGRGVWQQDAGAETGDEDEGEAAEPGDEIEQQTARCMEADPSSPGMSACLAKEYAARDAQLNQAYQALRAKLSPELQKALKASQVKWIEHRDLELKLLDAIFTSKEFTGTLWVQAAQQLKNEVVRARAKALDSYVEQYNITE